MTAARRLVALLLAVTMLVAPLAPARAAGDAGAPASRVGVLLAVMCGLSLRAAIPAPVPWAGIAVVSCIAAFIDAALSSDTNPSADPPPPAKP